MSLPPPWWEAASSQLIRKQEETFKKYLGKLLDVHNEAGLRLSHLKANNKQTGDISRLSSNGARSDTVRSWGFDKFGSDSVRSWGFDKFMTLQSPADSAQNGAPDSARESEPHTPRYVGREGQIHTPRSLVPRIVPPQVVVTNHDPAGTPDVSPRQFEDPTSKEFQLLSGKSTDTFAVRTPSMTSGVSPKDLSRNVSFATEQHRGRRAVRHWEKLYIGKLANKQPETKSAKEHVQFHLRPIWFVSVNPAFDNEPQTRDEGGPEPKSNRMTMNRSMSMADKNAVMDHVRMGHVMQSEYAIRRFVRHPDKMVSVAYSLISSTFIMIDVMLMPFSLAFYDGNTPFFHITELSTAIFWTLDIPMSFLQGFHHADVVELRPSYIAKHYLRRWFWLDLLLVVTDWITITVQLMDDGDSSGGVSMGTSVARVGHSMRFVRFLRALRILRLRKAMKTMNYFLDAMARQEWLLILVRIIGLMVMVALINHYVACAWYSIGMSESGPTWIKAEMLEDGDDFSRYISAFHWSLTQFTPATNNVGPMNTSERFFSVLVVLFALFIFSSFLSALTNATLEMKRLSATRINEEETIRKFMYTKRVSIELGSRVWHYYRNHYRKRGRPSYEIDIPFFQVMPKSLRTALHTQIYMPTLLEHPLFDRFSANNYPSLVMFCDTAVVERSFDRGDEIFAEAEEAKSMFFLTSGVLQYKCPFYGQAKDVEASSFISEAALWSYWIHCGQLTGKSSPHSEILLLDAFGFENAVRRTATDKGLNQLRRYAALFAERVNESMEEQSRRSSGDDVRVSKSFEHAASQKSAKSVYEEDIQVNLITDVMQDVWLTRVLVRRAFVPATRRLSDVEISSDNGSIQNKRGLQAIAHLMTALFQDGVSRMSVNGNGTRGSRRPTGRITTSTDLEYDAKNDPHYYRSSVATVRPTVRQSNVRGSMGASLLGGARGSVASNYDDATASGSSNSWRAQFSK